MFREKIIPIEEILETSDGRSMSQKQLDSISNRSIKYIDDGNTISGYTYFQLYGVSADDVQKMSKAFLEIIANRANKNRQSSIKRKNELSVEIAEAQKQLTEKQKQQKNIEERFKKAKRTVYYLSPEEAKKTVEKLNATIDELSIEIAGMNIKLKAIDEEHKRAKESMRSFEQQEIYQNTIWPKLELMRIDQIIDLRVAEKKRSIASSIRQEAEQFYVAHQRNNEKQLELIGLKRRLSDYQGQLDSINKNLSTEPKFQPLKIFQNKVTIYPVR
jgi:chromosome segregation ATPase